MKTLVALILTIVFSCTCFAVPPEDLVLTQATIANHNQVQRNLVNRTLTLTNWNGVNDNDWPNALYDDVDYVILGDIDFSAISYSLIVEEGTTVWFWLEMNDQLEPGDPEFVTSVSNLIFKDNRHIQCGELNDNLVNLRPSEELDAIFDDIDVNGYPKGSGSVHAGGIVCFRSPNNSIVNTHFQNGIGQLVVPTEFEQENPATQEMETYVRWDAEDPVGAIQISNNPEQNPCELELSNTSVEGSFFNGIFVFGRNHTLDIDNSEITDCFYLNPQYDGAPNLQHWDNSGLFEHSGAINAFEGFTGNTVYITSSLFNNNDGYGVILAGWLNDFQMYASECCDNQLSGIWFEHAFPLGEPFVAHQIQIDNSIINSNGQLGIWITHGRDDEVIIGEWIGNCEIDENDWGGLVFSGINMNVTIANSSSISNNGALWEDPPQNWFGDGLTVDSDNSSFIFTHNVSISNNHGNGILIYGDENQFHIRQQSIVNANDFNGLSLTGHVVANVRYPYSGNSITVDSCSQVCTNLGLDWGLPQTGDGIHLSILDETTVEVKNGSIVSSNEDNGIYGLGLQYSEINVETQSEVNTNGWSGINLTGAGVKAGPQISLLNVVTVANSECDGNEGVDVDPGELEENIGGIVAEGDRNVIILENSSVLGNGWFGVRNMGVGENVGSATININESDILDNGYTGVSIYRVKDLTITDSQIDGCGNIGVYAGRESVEQLSEFNVDISNTDIGVTQGNGSHGICLEKAVEGVLFSMATDVVISNVRIDNSGLIDQAASGLVVNGLSDLSWVGGDNPRRRYDENTDILLEDIEIHNNSETCVNGISMDRCAYLQTVLNDVSIDRCPVGLLLQYTREDLIFDETINLRMSGFMNTSDFESPSQIGLHADHCSNLQLRVLSHDEEGNDNSCNFYNQTDAGILIESDNLHPPRVLIEGAGFIVTTVPRSPTHIQLVGRVLGWDDEENPVNFGCIRKCRFLDGGSGIELTDDFVVDPPNSFQPNVAIVNNAFLFYTGTGVLVNYHGSDFDDNIFLTIANNTFRGVSEGGSDCGVFMDNLLEEPEFPVLTEDNQLFNNIFYRLDAAIIQADDNVVEPLFRGNCFFGNTVNCVNCDEDDSVTAAPRFSNSGTSSYRLDWRSPCINAGLTAQNGSPWPNETSTIHDVTYTTRTDIGCTGGPYAGIECANIIPSETVLDDDAAAGVAWISIQNKIADLPNDDYEIIGSFTIDDDYLLNIIDNTTFLVGDQFYISPGTRINIEGSVVENNVTLPRVYFGPRLDDWTRIYVWNPGGNCTFDGCTITGATTGIYYQGSTTANGIDMTVSNCDISNMASYGIYCYNPSGDGAITNTTVDNCGSYGIDLWNTGIVNLRTFTLTDVNITNAGSRGLVILDNVQALCQDIEVSDCAKQGVYLNGNYNVGVGTQSRLERVNVTHCNTSVTSTTEAGIYVYESNPLITECFVHDNFDYGIYVTNTSDPAINGVDDQHANNILNNGNPGSQTNTLGAEIRLADSNSMEAGGVIQYINIYDIRNGNRDGKIASKSGSEALNIDFFYFGNGRTANWAAGDLYASSNPWTTSNDNGDTPFEPDEWGNVDVDGDEEELAPANSFEEGIAAMKAGEFALAVSKLWEWIGEQPASHSAASAVHAILRSERARESNLWTLRATFLALADTSENYPDLAWMARRMAVKCLIYSGEREAGREEYESMRALAPSVIDSLFLELDILFLQEDIDGAHIASIDDREAKLNDMIEELFAAGEIQGTPKAMPIEFELSAAYPNPFNGTTHLSFEVPKASDVTISVFGIDGRLVETLICDRLEAGRYSVAWNGNNYSAGLYVLRMNAGSFTSARRLVLVK